VAKWLIWMDYIRYNSLNASQRPTIKFRVHAGTLIYLAPPSINLSRPIVFAEIAPKLKNEENDLSDWCYRKPRHAITQYRMLQTHSNSNESGGSVAKLLLQYGERYEVRCLTRDLASRNAKALVEKGAMLVQGDLTDPSTLSAAVKGCWGVFAVTNFYDAVCNCS
jgi:hypothetical protein